MSCEGGGSLKRYIIALRYDSAGALVTVIENLQDLQLEGYSVDTWARGCEHEGAPHPEVPLTGWLPVTCGGREALADHPLSEGPTSQDTTLIIPDVQPLVIVTSDPTSTCEDAARLHTEWSA